MYDLFVLAGPASDLVLDLTFVSCCVVGDCGDSLRLDVSLSDDQISYIGLVWVESVMLTSFLVLLFACGV